MTTTSELGPVGISLDIDPAGGHLAAAAEIERLGYSTLWIPGGQLDRLDRITELVRATRRVTVAPGIIPVDVYPADAVARWHAELSAEAPGRVLVGLGGPQQDRARCAPSGTTWTCWMPPTRRYRRRGGSWPRSARASWRWPGTAPAVRCRCW
jgi:hypothetical protein